MKTILKSKKLENVCYDIRGPVLEEAYRMEEAGQRILKLNIGNPAPFGFMAPDEILKDVVYNLPQAEGYSESRGMFAARKAVMHETQRLGIPGVQINDIYLGNGASELIAMALMGLCDLGDEILIPAPDYPLWTASTSLAGGKPVHYLCDENNGWNPDIADIRSKITARTRAIVVINPNNPTGALYDHRVLEQIVDIAREHGLIIFADEIYDKILYEDAQHTPMGTLATDVLCVTFNGLSKTYRLAGFRSGWMIISGAKELARDYIEGLDMLASMRLCANVPAQYAIQTALGGYQSIQEYIQPGGRLREQRDIAWKMLNDIPGVSCVKPMGALYMFPRLDPAIYPIKDDEQLALDFLRQKKILIVQGSGFNWVDQQHFRIVILPRVDELKYAIEQFADFISKYQQ
ncbi:MAG: pyridoxal phosphate-dependent aminotransferase [Pseudomonadales bacterium]|jgi:alanine-synthesizing transaminase|nr:pyridoxal phosphate-dependent aminotransferase [Pseudomonadales bacterium]